MKPVSILFKLSIALLLLVTVAGCKKEKATGVATFYSLNYGPTATVSINGQSGIISQYFTYAITDCNTQGCANFTVPAGTYSYTASSSLFTWSGNITVDQAGCSVVQLANPNTTFYSPNFNNISVQVGGQTGNITQMFSTNPGCAVSGCANFFLVSGNYSFSATAQNGTTWGPTSLTVDQTTCNTVTLQ